MAAGTGYIYIYIYIDPTLVCIGNTFIQPLEKVDTHNVAAAAAVMGQGWVNPTQQQRRGGLTSPAAAAAACQPRGGQPPSATRIFRMRLGEHSV